VEKVNNKIKTIDIEIAVAEMYDWRQNIIVTNVDWGIALGHECDLLIVRPKSGYTVEVEIKVSMSDLKADFKKLHDHYSQKIKELYFAVPEDLYEKVVNIIPDYAGIITCGLRQHRRWQHSYPEHLQEWWQIDAEVRRKAKQNENRRPLTPEEILHLSHLGTMRIWNLKKKLRKIQNNQNGNS